MNFFSDNTRVRILFFLSRKARIFFSEFNIMLYDKNSESDFFFPPPKSEYFFQHQDILNLDILLKGSPILTVEEDTEIFDAVHHFITGSRRFT
jgi:hypothetical protein